MSRRSTVETLPPQDLRAEMSVIGACLRDGRTVSDLAEIIGAHHFYRSANAAVWDAIVSLVHRGEPVDTVTVASEMKRLGNDNAGEVYDYLAECHDATPTASNATHYARLVVEAYVRREVVRLAADMEAGARDESRDISDVISSVTSKALDLQLRREAEGDLRPVRDIMDEFERVVEQGPTRLQNRICTGFRSIDEMIGGFQPSDLHYWGGGPGSGKTTLSMQSAMRVAQTQKDGLVAYFSMELGEGQFARRSATFCSEVEGKIIEHGPASRLSLELPKIRRGLQRLRPLPMYVAFGRFSTSQIAQRCQQLMARENRRLTALFIDRLELLSDSDCASMEETKRIPILSPRVKGLATSLNTPVVCLVQLNRAGRAGDPTMESFRGSGAIEQDCQVGLIIRSDKIANTAVIDVVKHNDGSTGPCATMRFLPHLPMFQDMQRAAVSA